jgi:hypothetical protein
MQPEKTQDENKGVLELTMIKEFWKIEAQQGRKCIQFTEKVGGLKRHRLKDLLCVMQATRKMMTILLSWESIVLVTSRS